MITPKNFKCNRCGSCCRISPFLTNEDINRVKKLGYKEKQFIEELKGKKFIRMLGNKCIFLDNRNKITSCKIYKARPQICREYPTEIRENGDCRPEILKFDKKIRDLF